MTSEISLDVLIFGGGIAGLWLLDELLRQNCNAVLLETTALGHGQTIASQGIIHGGLKYMFDGNLNPSAKAISEMPPLWQDCLQGKRLPSLTGVQVRSPCCYVWGTGSIKSRIFVAGSSIALRAGPAPVDRPQWPAALAKVPGKVLRVPEPVLDSASLLKALAAPHRTRILQIDDARPPEFTLAPHSIVEAVRVFSPSLQSQVAPSFVLRPRFIVLTAGEGNAFLRQRLGLNAEAMQRRPLHMAMVRGPLPSIYGHCVGGPKPRLTVTSVIDSHGRTVWQLGGQIAEEGISQDRNGLVRFCKTELEACIPGLDLSKVEYSSYRVNRAEAATSAGQRPEDAQIVQEGNIITAWPTKLALAHAQFAELVIAAMNTTHATQLWTSSPGHSPLPPPVALTTLPTPPIAKTPWETETEWLKVD